MLLPPLLLFLKDLVAINLVLATEPGITSQTARYFALSQLPGPLFFDEASHAMVFTQILAFLLGGLISFLAARRSRRQATQPIIQP